MLSLAVCASSVVRCAFVTLYALFCYYYPLIVPSLLGACPCPLPLCPLTTPPSLTHMHLIRPTTSKIQYGGWPLSLSFNFCFN